MTQDYDCVRYNENIEYTFYEEKLLKGFSLFSMKMTNLYECIAVLKSSYASAFSYDVSNKTCFFKVNPEFVKSEGKIELKIAKGFITVIKKQTKYDGIIVPTYINDLAYFKILCKSLNKITDKTTINIIFSSYQEAQSMMEVVFPLYGLKQNITTNLLIFDIEYTNRNKFNYQCVKKLWGLERLKYDNIMIMDSDFEFINSININDEMEKHADIIYENSYSLIMFDKLVLDNINELLKTEFHMFPLDLLWIVNKQYFTRFLEDLAKIKPDYVEFFLDSSKIYFEIIMYRFFILKNFPKQFQVININDLCIKYDKKFVWDMDLDEEELKKYKNIVISNLVKTENKDYLIRVHNDRK